MQPAFAPWWVLLLLTACAAQATEPAPSGIRGFELSLTTVAQSLTDVAEGPRSLVTTYYVAEGVWQPAARFRIRAKLEGGQVIGPGAGETLGNSLRSQWDLNELQENSPLFVAMLYVFGTAAEGRLGWRLGRISPKDTFDDNRVARSKRTKFIAEPLARNPAVAFAAKGLGGALQWEFSPRAQLAVCASDANARSTGAGFSSWRGEWFRVAELTVQPRAGATVRVLAWGTERGGVHDGGWGLSSDWEVAPHWVLFSRFGAGAKQFARSRHLMSGGLAWEKPLGRAQDFLALGVARGEALRGGQRTELLAELVYRWQVSRQIALSPDVQYVYHPARSSGPGAWAFGLRVMVSPVR